MSFDLKDYDFYLPEELIAQSPSPEREGSRLLVVDVVSKKIQHASFSDLSKFLPSRSLIIANNSKVMKARLLGNRLTEEQQLAGKVEFFLLEKKADQGEHVWEGMFHASAKYKKGLRFFIPSSSSDRRVDGLTGELITNSTDSPQGLVVAKFDRDPLESEFGLLPLPPYIKPVGGVPRDFDLERYQTTYAKKLGSVAAPTAGLHFTQKTIAQLKDQGHDWEEITLHVGLGTFRPVKSADIREHQMHEERVFISENIKSKLKQAKGQGTPVMAVGTTSLRAIESLSEDVEFSTGIYFYPGGNTPKCVDLLLTNFHLPKSSLFLLVCALAGTDLMKCAYQQAIAEMYRFFSYGDAMLIRVHH